MRIQPSSTINLYSGVDIDMEEQLAFSSRANQQAYFASKLVRAQYPCTMVRKTGLIRIEINQQLPATTLKTCNYISFINPNFDNKEVYARILDYDYVNNETVDIAYGIDYWQTWMFDVTFKDSYIEREHLSETLFNLAESNPYDINIPEFRTAETLPINGEVEKYYYDICPDASNPLTYDGFKVGKIIENDLGVTDKIGVLLKLANIDFENLDSNDTEIAQSGTVTNNGSNQYQTVATISKGVISSQVTVYTLVKGSDADSPTVRYLLDLSGINTSEYGWSNPYTYVVSGDDVFSVRITEDTTNYYLQIRVDSTTPNYTVRYNVNKRTIGATIDKPGQIFVNILNDIANQDCGYWQLPYGVYKYLNDTYGLTGMNGFKQNGSWVYNGHAMSPFGSNDFKNKCIYIYDENGGSFESDPGTSYYSPISTLLTYLTLWDCVSSIVNMFAIPNNFMLMSGSQSSSGAAWQVTQKTVKTVLNVTNKKLMLYPFSYLRLVMPNGDIKELRFEDFLNVRNGGDVCGLELMLDISDAPIFIGAPYQYKMGGFANKTVNDCNIQEAIFYKQFPTAPYIIDAYLAQVSNYTREVLKSNTLEQLYNYATDLINASKTSEAIHDMGVYSNIIGAVAGGSRDFGFDVEKNTYDASRVGKITGMSGVAGLASGAMAGVNTAAGQFGYSAGLANARAQLERIGQERSNVGNVFGGDISGAIGRQLGLTRGSYACDQYVASNGVGTTNFNVLSFMDIIFMRVTLNNVMLERFDNYFTHYGYTSGRCGIPRVCAFVNGSSDNDVLPHWLSVNGKPSTYIKTIDCKVTHSMLPVEAQIKAMFDGGVRMINGDPTTP